MSIMKQQLRNQYGALHILGGIALVLIVITKIADREVLAATGGLLSLVGIGLVITGVKIGCNIFKLENRDIPSVGKLTMEWQDEQDRKDFDVRR